MPDLKFAVLFTAVDKLSDKFGSIGSAASDFFGKMTSGSAKIGELGERMTNFGERLALTTAILSEGAEKMHEWAETLSEPALSMEHSMASMAAMTGLAAGKLGEIKDHAIAFANANPSETSEQWADSFTRFSGVFKNTSDAVAASDMGGKLARFGLEGTTAFDLLTVANRNFGLGAKEAGADIMGAIQAFKLPGESASALARGIGSLGGTAAQTHTPMNELIAILGVGSEQMGGGARGMTKMAASIRELVEGGKSGVDWSHGLTTGFQELNRNLAGVDPTAKAESLKKMGVSADPAGMLKYLDNLGLVGTKTKEVTDGAARSDEIYAKATANAADQIKIMHHQWASFGDALMTPALPWVNARLGELAGLTQWATEAAEDHKWAAEGLSVALLGVGYGASSAISALSAIGTVTVGLGQTLKFVQEWEVATKVAALGTYAWTAAQWALDAALDAVGFGELILGAVALAGAAVAIYENWGAVGNFFTGIWHRIESIDWRGLGVSILKNIGEGMLDATGLGALARGAEKVAGLISDHFPHSPAKLGPLRDLGRLRIVESIAETMRPGPMMAAAGRTAAAIAIAAPMMIASAAPAMAGGFSAGAGGGGIVINAPVTVTVGAGTDKDAIEKIVVGAFTRHRYELVRAVQGELAKRERTKLS